MLAMAMSAGSTGFGNIILPLIALLGFFGFVMLLSGGNGRSKTNPVVRLIWFLFIGWWLGIIWFSLSLALMLTILFLPVGAWAMTKTWKVMTLAGSSGPRDAVTDVSVDVENKMKQQVSDNEESQHKDGEDEFDKLEKLKDLKDEGVITEEEFEEKKDDLMDDI
ncbi:MAG: SHOCT domain-containing protein [Nanohaloarchaea archaeon]|nr:SHOCT domain-containing protein [Candidatus Nanohaloarchaea archaeon]